MSETSRDPLPTPEVSITDPRGIWQRYHGVGVMVLTIVVVEAVQRSEWPLPNPGSYYALSVAYSAASGGLLPGLASAVLGIAAIAVDASKHGAFHYDHDGKVRIVGNIFAFLGMALVVGLLKRRNDTLAQENGQRLLEARTRDVEAAAARRNEAKLARVAETLQRSLLLTPPQDLLPGVTLSTYYESAWDEAEVGGDFYDAFVLQNGMVALVVGDVTGKGLAAAARTAEVKYVLRAYLRENPACAADAMARLNRFLCVGTDFADGETEKEYICLSLALLNPATGEVQIVAAGSEPPLFLRAGESISVEPSIRNDEESSRSCPMLGVDVEGTYRSVNSVLKPGDALLLLTDGITEARRTSDRVFFADDHLYPALIRTIGTAGSAGDGNDALRDLTDAARQFVGGQLRDDVCLLMVRLR